MNTVADLMALWPTVSEFARDIGIKPTHAHTMRVRGSIPLEHWPAIIKAAGERGFDGVTSDALLRIHAPAAAQAEG